MLKSLVIDRATWGAGNHLGGRGSSPSCLLSQGRRCCLGFLGVDVGLLDHQMEQWSLPSDVHGPWPVELFGHSSYEIRSGDGALSPQTWECAFAALNDEREIDDATREEWIRVGFRLLLSRVVVFKGKYHDGPRGDDGELL